MRADAHAQFPEALNDGTAAREDKTAHELRGRSVATNRYVASVWASSREEQEPPTVT
jgi:hypothetical protein